MHPKICLLSRHGLLHQIFASGWFTWSRIPPPPQKNAPPVLLVSCIEDAASCQATSRTGGAERQLKKKNLEDKPVNIHVFVSVVFFLAEKHRDEAPCCTFLRLMPPPPISSTAPLINGQKKNELLKWQWLPENERQRRHRLCKMRCESSRHKPKLQEGLADVFRHSFLALKALKD